MSSLPRSAVSLAELAQACRLGRVDHVAPSAQPTGFAELDRALPWGGWPIGAVSEVMPQTVGIGELTLLMPALAALTRERYVAFVAPPHLPYPPALIQRGVRLDRVLLVGRGAAIAPAAALWATEQMLRCAAFGAVLLWSAVIQDKEVRRLQLAAEKSGNLAIVYRPPSALLSASPAALRLALSTVRGALRIDIKKCRGGHPGAVVHCALPARRAS